MKFLKAVAILAVLSVMLFSVGCAKPKQEPPPQEPEVAAPPPSFPRETIPETTPPPTVAPAPAPGEQPITTVEPSEAAPHRKAGKAHKAKPKEKYASAKKSSGGGKSYVIKKGDTLQEISQKFYGTSKSWRKIASANKGVIKDPKKLPVGTKIVIP